MAQAPPVAAIIVAQGRVLDFIDGETQRRETPEEYVRQEIAKSLVREYGYRKTDIAVEFTIPNGSLRPRADLVVFDPGEDHKVENARLIVECKARTVEANAKKDGVEQLRSYMRLCPNVRYGLWTNGDGGDRRCFKRQEVDGKVTAMPVPDIPRAGQDEAEADRPTFDSLNPATSDALLFTFKRCNDFIKGNQGLSKGQAFEEFLKLIFCKIHDENSQRVDFFAGPNELHGVNGPVKAKQRIEMIFEAVKEDFPSIFPPREEIVLNPPVLAYIVLQLQTYSLLDSEIDIKGRAYEAIIDAKIKGERGEFFTPRNVCRMAVEMLDPGEDDLTLDPACGTAGFLITAMNHVIARIETEEEAKGGSEKRRAAAVSARKKRYVDKKVVGVDFNPDLVRASKMNMVLNNDGEGGLYPADSLKPPVTWPEGLRAREVMGRVRRLFTNPPYGKKVVVKDPTVLEQYELGHIWSYSKARDEWKNTGRAQKSQPAELLFVERCVQFLEPGAGRAAMVLPDGVLGSPGLGYVRQWLLRNTRVLASVDLHPDAFQPNVSIQTSLLVVERKSDEQIALEDAAGAMNDYPIFMAAADHVGHDKRGNITYVRDELGNELYRERSKPAPEIDDRGRAVMTTQTVTEKVIDDNTAQIAQEFRRWLSTIE